MITLNGSVIYIENDEDESQFWQQHLGQLGYAVQAVGGFELALAWLQEGEYDLIILNQKMPGYTCLEMLNLLQGQGISIPVIVVASASDPEETRQAYASGVRHYIIQDEGRHYINQLPAAIHQAMEQERLLRELEEERIKTQRLNRNLMLLNRISQLLTSTFDLTEVCNQLVTTIAQIINAEGSTVWLLEKGAKKYLSCAAVYSRGNLVPPETLSIPVTEGIAGWVATHGKSQVVTDVSQDSRFSPKTDNALHFTTTSMTTVPLRSHDKLLGVLQVVNPADLNNIEEDQMLVETLAGSAAVAIENATLFEELREQNQELERQNADLDAYSGTVAHDLKNPITHFLSFADDLRERFPEMSLREVESHLDIILLQSRRMSRIIESLLLLARVRSMEDIPINGLDMPAILSKVLLQLEVDIREKDARIKVPSEWHNALGYSPWVESIWHNYLTNGLKYGGVPPQLKLGSEVDEKGMVHYWIQDQGEGLTSEEQAKLFTPYPKIKRRQGQGHGLGLVIVKRIAKKLGGDVRVESAPGQGSRFVFSLPQQKTNQEESHT